MVLTPRYLDDLPLPLIELYSQVEQDILADMARRIAKMGYATDTAKWQYAKLREMGNFRGYILNALAALTKKTRKELERLFDDAALTAMAFDDAVYKRAGKNPRPIAESPALQDVVREGMKKTNGLYKNLTGTIANTATKQFEDALDHAYLQVASGAFTPQEAIRRAVKGLAADGMQTITYPSGRRDHMDVAIRRATLTGLNQTCAGLQLAHAGEMDCDLVQVTSHLGARPEHAVWQGKIFSLSGKHPKYPDFASSTGYGTGPGLCGWNCRHSFYPFFEGLSVDNYERYDLEENNRVYAESQRQRAMERRIRKDKRECAAFDAAGLRDDFDRSAAKLKRHESGLKEFLRETGRMRRNDREQAPGFGRGQSGKAVWAAKKQPKSVAKAPEKNLAKASKSATLKAGRSRWTPDALKQLTQDEKILAGYKKERAVLYDATGKRVLIKKGDESSVTFTASDIKRMENGVLTHNHPHGTTFSCADINMLLKAKLAEIRAVGEDGAFSLKMNPHWPSEINSWRKLKQEYDFIEKAVEPAVRKRLEAGEIDLLTYNRIYQNQILTEFAQKYGFEYRFEGWE